MNRRLLGNCLLVATAALAATALAHEEHESQHGGHGGVVMASNSSSTPKPTSTAAATTSLDDLPYYFAHPEHSGLLRLHIAIMVVAWVFIMPIAVMFSIAGSRYHLPVQIAFLATNAAGMAASVLYNSMTPDLYPGNSHHKLGWALAIILAAQAGVGVLGAVVRRCIAISAGASWAERTHFMRIPLESPGDGGEAHLYRQSDDSGRGRSVDSPIYEEWHRHADADADADGEKLRSVESGQASRWSAAIERWLSMNAPWVFNERMLAVCDFVYSLVARFLVPLAFVQLSLGVVTGSGMFMGDRVFNGLAHFIKGGIFFLYGILTLGRWAGAFAEIGHSWNVKPRFVESRWRARAPTAEQVESGLIFIYGCSNVFLEHLAGSGGSWTHSDLQHVSIAFMFFGGGLCGLLVESKWVRSLLNQSNAPSAPGFDGDEDEKRSGFCFNPLPAIVIFVLGTLMSQHHQHSKLSTVIHTQWGALLAAAAAFRLFTYVLFFRSPPTSTLPSRPPTELVAAFCLMAGGLVFMVSNKDTVGYLDRIGVDAMFSLTVTVGLTVLVMSWELVVLALKGWAVRRSIESA